MYRLHLPNWKNAGCYSERGLNKVKPVSLAHFIDDFEPNMWASMLEIPVDKFKGFEEVVVYGLYRKIMKMGVKKRREQVSSLILPMWWRRNVCRRFTDDIRERLDFELATIEKTGYPGYFLIVQDFIAEARNMGVSVGPGRGSAAGSAVAYCLGITNIDPIQYDLLFERFLNPDRVSMPDIDNLTLMMKAVSLPMVQMAAKYFDKDTARVLDLPLSEANEIAKLIPNLKLSKIFNMDEKALKEALRAEELEAVHKLISLADGAGLEAETIKQARVLEGSMQITGIHGLCGVIITPDDITNFVPVSLAKDSDLYVTQFDNSVVESAGLLKMDFLGLKTLTLIKDTCANVQTEHNHGSGPDNFPIR
ncbi:hypothetical protein FQR65_LT16755 [Abscondita terminalis]|nr:hypothetical protein FQR65_LT16755 [Abscondita terminalis]